MGLAEAPVLIVIGNRERFKAVVLRISRLHGFSRRDNWNAGRIVRKVRRLLLLIFRAPVQELLVDSDDSGAPLVMFHDASQFGFSGQVLLPVIKFVIVNSGRPVDTPMIWNLEEVEGFRQRKLALWPAAVKRGDRFHRLLPRSGVPIVKDPWSQKFASRGWIILFTRGDERFDHIDEFRRNFRIFNRRERLGSAAAVHRFAVQDRTEARQDHSQEENTVQARIGKPPWPAISTRMNLCEEGGLRRGC